MNNTQFNPPLSSPETRTAAEGWAARPAENSHSTMIASKQSIDDLLKATSRSFYLTLRVLPARVRRQIGLSYLLARTTCTIAATEILPPAQRLHALETQLYRV